MNVLVTNKKEDELSDLMIQISKSLRGEYDVDEIISQFSNFFFARMILDITAIRDYKNIINFQKLSIGLPVDKIILFLTDDIEDVDPMFISKLISMGFYNFGKTMDDIKYLLEHPNTYKDVVHLHHLEQTQTPIASNVVVGNVKVPTQVVVTDEIKPMKIIKIIGVKNVTSSAGATTLVYLMKRELETIYHKSVLAVEVDKREFIYFNDNSLVSVNKKEFPHTLARGNNYDVILVDLNDADPSICDDVIYLVEPSIIKLNKLMRLDNNAFDKLKNKKVVLNKTLVSGGNINTLEYETGIKVFDVIKPLDDRMSSPMLTSLLEKLNLIDKQM